MRDSPVSVLVIDDEQGEAAVLVEGLPQRSVGPGTRGTSGTSQPSVNEPYCRSLLLLIPTQLKTKVSVGVAEDMIDRMPALQEVRIKNSPIIFQELIRKIRKIG